MKIPLIKKSPVRIEDRDRSKRWRASPIEYIGADWSVTISFAERYKRRAEGKEKVDQASPGLEEG